MHQRDLTEIISVESQLQLQPDGGNPYVTYWPMKLLFKSNRDDPSNIYCAPNNKISVAALAYYYSNQFNTSLADNKKMKNNLRRVVCTTENNVHNNVHNFNLSSEENLTNSTIQNNEYYVSNKNKQIINNCIIQERIRFQIENSENKNELIHTDDYDIKKSTQKYDEMGCEKILTERRRKMKLRRRGGGSRGRAYKNE